MEALFGSRGITLVTFDRYAEPEEGDTSYADNAALKARTLHDQLREAGLPANVLADDSGLEVYALDGRPGVLTAYYGGAGVPWAERRQLLLDELTATGSDDRRARFVCALHLITEVRREFTGVGTVEGVIAQEERGTEGFSFDPVFVHPPSGRTFAEMPDWEKNAVSHRTIAVSRLIGDLEAAGLVPVLPRP
jgi:XTP/dITP diphosphohydrolase